MKASPSKVMSMLSRLSVLHAAPDISRYRARGTEIAATCRYSSAGSRAHERLCTRDIGAGGELACEEIVQREGMALSKHVNAQHCTWTNGLARGMDRRRSLCKHGRAQRANRLGRVQELQASVERVHERPRKFRQRPHRERWR